MPLFSKGNFKSGKKPQKRKSVSISNISSLDESTYSVNDLKIEAGPLTMKLGENELVFEKGQWHQVAADGKTVIPPVNEETHKKLLEENYLLKYKIELLLDMLAASNADNFVLQKELQDLKKKTKLN